MRRYPYLLFIVAVLLAACSGGGQNPPPGGRPVVVPETTKVADGATRAVLTFFDLGSGTMRFAGETPLLAALRPDDVLVGEPSAAAPDGYLRKVKAIRREVGEVVLETTQANLTDAVHQGELEASGDLMPEDLCSASAFVEGLSVGRSSRRPISATARPSSTPRALPRTTISGASSRRAGPR